MSDTSGDAIPDPDPPPDTQIVSDGGKASYTYQGDWTWMSRVSDQGYRYYGCVRAFIFDKPDVWEVVLSDETAAELLHRSAKSIARARQECCKVGLLQELEIIRRQVLVPGQRMREVRTFRRMRVVQDPPPGWDGPINCFREKTRIDGARDAAQAAAREARQSKTAGQPDSPNLSGRPDQVKQGGHRKTAGQPDPPNLSASRPDSSPADPDSSPAGSNPSGQEPDPSPGQPHVTGDDPHLPHGDPHPDSDTGSDQGKRVPQEVLQQGSLTPPPTTPGNPDPRDARDPREGEGSSPKGHDGPDQPGPAATLLRSAMDRIAGQFPEPNRHTKAALLSLVAGLLERGVAEGSIYDELLRSLSGVRDLGSVWLTRLRQLPLPAASPRRAVGPPCGECDGKPDEGFYTRVIYLDAEKNQKILCPRCHPDGLAAAADIA